MIRHDWNDKIFRTLNEKDFAIINKIKEINNEGQPILIFTANINKSEHYSKLLKQQNISHTVLNAKNHEREADIIANAGKKNSVIITTSISGRGVDIKLGGKTPISNEDKMEVKSLGGLFVIGTERMESRRVDNQARGRSGRQGDQGSSIFFVSLEDDLMRIFGSESMNSMLEKLGLKDGESIDHPWINKALERAQQKVEARNFDVRKTLLKFDNVLNDQRKVIFDQRNNIIGSKNIYEYSDEFLNEILIKLNQTKKTSTSKKNNNEINNQLKSIFGKSFSDNEINKILDLNEDDFLSEIKKKFNQKRFERENILSKEQSLILEKRILLQLIDQNWKSHIQYLEQLRGVIGLRSYGNRDPLIEYKKEAFSLFENLLNKLKTDLITVLINLQIVKENIGELNSNETKNYSSNPKCLLILNKGKKISRNEKCSATGKKFKQCCGAL